MRSKLDLPIEAPTWLSVENRTDESAVMLSALLQGGACGSFLRAFIHNRPSLLHL